MKFRQNMFHDDMVSGTFGYLLDVPLIFGRSKTTFEQHVYGRNLDLSGREAMTSKGEELSKAVCIL